MTQHLDLDALQAAAEAATPGPWNYVGTGVDDFGGEFQEIESPSEIITGEYAGLSKENAAFVAAFNPQIARALIDRLRKAEAARNGYQLVPIEPTPVMISEAWRALIGNADYAKIRNAWGQMLAAAPDSTPTDSAEKDKP